MGDVDVLLEVLSHKGEKSTRTYKVRWKGNDEPVTERAGALRGHPVFEAYFKMIAPPRRKVQAPEAEAASPPQKSPPKKKTKASKESESEEEESSEEESEHSEHSEDSL